MSHLSVDLLRRSLDEPETLLSYEKAHILQCAACRSRRDDLRADAEFVHRALQASHPVDMPNARQKIAALAGREMGARAMPSWTAGSYSLPPWTLAAAITVALVLALSYAPLRGFAQNLLAIFEPRQFQSIGLTTSDIDALRRFSSLRRFGVAHGAHRERVTNFLSAAAASKAAGYPVAIPRDLPAELPKGVTYRVASHIDSRFTFSAAKARESGATPMPARVNGSTITMLLGPVVVQTYGDRRALQRLTARRRGRIRHDEIGFADIPNNLLVISQAPALRVFSNGASLTEIEAYMLSQPGLPANVVKQIREISSPSATLPIPINLNKETAQATTIRGANGLLVGDNTGVGAAVVWQQGGMVYGVAGPFTSTRILQIASSLTP